MYNHFFCATGILAYYFLNEDAFKVDIKSSKKINFLQTYILLTYKLLIENSLLCQNKEKRLYLTKKILQGD